MHGTLCCMYLSACCILADIIAPFFLPQRLFNRFTNAFLVLALHQAEEEIREYVLIFWHFPIPRKIVDVNDIEAVSGPMLSDYI